MLLLQHFATMTPVIVTEIQEQVTRLQEQVTRFQEEKERADRLQEQVTRLQEQVTRLQEEKERADRLQEQVTRLQEEKARSEERADRLQEKKARSEERAARLQEQVTRLQETQIESKAPVSKYISEEQLKDTDLTYSKIQKCEIRNGNGDLISDNTTYIGICRDIWDSMESTEKIKKHTTFNHKNLIKQKEPIGNGFKWCKEAGLYIQDQNANKTFLEILKMVKVQSYTIEISIQLKDSDKKDIEKIYYKHFL